MALITRAKQNILDNHTVVTGTAPCLWCRHLLSITDRECRAFSGYIPAKIFRGDSQHADPMAGDNGIQFEPIEDTDADNS